MCIRDRPKKVEINLIIPSFDEAYQLMLSNSPSLNILDKRVTSAKIGVKQSWASSLPSLSMNLGYNATSSDQITKQYFEDNYIKSANLTLSIPLFNGFRKRNDIKISKLAQGLPVGGQIESLDDGTLFSAFKNRTQI